MHGGDDPGQQPLPPDLGRLLHDLRGPLNSVTMHLQVLKRAIGDDVVAEESVGAALQQLGRLSEMLPAALEVTSLELGPLRPIEVGVLARRVRESEALSSVTIAEGDWPRVVGDETLLALALGHLLHNAAEATAGAGATRPPIVSGSLAGEEALVCVRDWGPGLRTTDPKLLIKLMHSTKPKHRGLGLVIVERIARLHGGSLRFESPGDGGALVTLALPPLR